MHPRSFVTAGAMLLAVLGCRDETTAPTQGGPTLQTSEAATTALSFRQVSAGRVHTCAVTTDYRAYCWGSNGAGQIGNGAFGASVTRPVAVQGGLHIRQVSAGSEFTCAVTTDDHAYCWGHNQFGKLGNGTIEVELCFAGVPCSTRPLPVAGGLRFEQVGAGQHHACGVTTDERVYCWGWNGFGGLGDGTHTDHLTPVAVARSVRFTHVDVGNYHTCAVTPTHHSYCWGANFYGQLGTRGGGRRHWSDDQLRPAVVPGGLKFRQVNAGYYVTCGVTAGSRGYCWGDNSWGQLGNGSSDDSFRVPSRVEGDLAFRAVDPSGYLFTCGVTTGNHAYCWGSGSFGNGSRGQSRVPVQVTGGLRFAEVSTGYYHACGLTTDAQVYCWGANFSGQLGDGTTTDRLTPTPVADPL